MWEISVQKIKASIVTGTYCQTIKNDKKEQNHSQLSFKTFTNL